MIKVIPGEIISKVQPTPNTAVMLTEILDIASREQIDWFEFVSIWSSYRTDKRLPKEKRKVKIIDKLRMRNKAGKIITVTKKKGERTEIALRRLFVKDGRYELASVIEAMAAQEDYNNARTQTNTTS